MHGFGPIEREPDEPVFHARWEAVVLGMQRALTRGRVCTIDEFRHAVERMLPAAYLASSYYERWLDALCRLAVEKGLVTPEGLETRARALPESGLVAAGSAGPARLSASPGMPAERDGEPGFRREPAHPPRFAIGQAVVARNDHRGGHTRLPRYARGRRGVVVAHYGTQVLPDANAHGLGERPEPLYCVRFEARELWGEGAGGRDAVHLDLWESYLLPG